MSTVDTPTRARAVPARVPATSPAAPAPVTLGSHPPKARLVLNVGVIAYGSEQNQAPLSPAMVARVTSMLETAAEAAEAVGRTTPEAFQAGAPILRVVSTLETRLERETARLALERGFEVQSVLPSHRTLLANDLSPEGAAELLALLGEATAVLELDGTCDGSTAAREAAETAAEILLDQSDVLLIIGDVNDPASRTAWYVVDQARERELATVALSPSAPTVLTITISDRVGSPTLVDLPALREHLVALTSPPVTDASGAKGDEANTENPVRDYFAEMIPARSWLAWTWTLFVGLVADGRLRRPAIRFTAFTSSIAEWDRGWRTRPALPPNVRASLDRNLRSPYVWADSLSLYYGGAYRGSFVVSTVLGMATVLLVLLTFAIGGRSNDDLSRIASVVFVLVILAVTWLANKRRWHERWLDYRLLAELLRQQRFLAPMGRVPKFARLPAHNSYDDPRGTWMAWQAHAVARDAGLVTARVNPEYREAYLSFLRDGLIVGIPPDTGQLGYHEAASRRFERLEVRAGDLKLGLMWAAIAVALIEVADHRLWTDWNLPVWFPALVAVFAGLGGAISSVAGQADAGRMKKRSRAMRERLEHLRGSLERPEAASSAAALGEVAEAAADAMVAELADYRMVFQAKPLRYPS